MKNLFLAACLFFCGHCSAGEFHNAIGSGIQYGGIIGWQGSISNDNLHGRVAIGLPGFTYGGDIDINKYISIGATAGVIAIVKVTALNLNFYPGRKHTESWRIGIDGGSAYLWDAKANFVLVSLGYAFR